MENFLSFGFWSVPNSLFATIVLVIETQGSFVKYGIQVLNDPCGWAVQPI
jgi:hypothetical protein